MSVYLTVAQVADELGVSIRTVQRWVSSGALRAAQLPGGRWRIRRDWLAEMIEGGDNRAARDGLPADSQLVVCSGNMCSESIAASDGRQERRGR